MQRSQRTLRLGRPAPFHQTVRVSLSVSRDAASSVMKVRFLSFSFSFLFCFVRKVLRKSRLFGPVFFVLFSFFFFVFAGSEFAEHGLVCVGGVLRATNSWQAIAREPVLQCVVALAGIVAVRASLKFAGPLKQLVCALWRRSRETKAKKKPRRPDTQAHAQLSTRSEG